MERREILFRGQTRRYGEKLKNVAGEPMESNWVYGGIFPNNFGSDFAIIYQQEPDIKKFSVYADTVGQYTGLTDKNGKKIFEGDILNTTNSNYAIWYVDYKNTAFCCNQGNANYSCVLDEFMQYSDVEVIGNIHDNPELLEVK